jgi:hypothetical protein
VSAAGRLARNALSFDLRTRRWSIVVGPTPREHLGVTSLAGTVYAVGGRTSGLDTNLLQFESYTPGARSWRRLQPVPDPRGGTGAAGLLGQIVSVGGEEPGGTIAEVLAYRVADRRWVQLDDLPTPRHGVGVAALGGRVFVIGGGPEPGLTVSSANEALRIGSMRHRRLSSARVSIATLTFRRADGSRIAFSGTPRAWCGAWNTDEPIRTLTVAVLKPGGRAFADPYWMLQAVVRDVRPGATIRFPLPTGVRRPRGAELFVADSRKRIEASSDEEEARGRIVFSEVGCTLGAPIRFTVTGALGSEVFGGKPVRVTGSYQGVVGKRPAGWPR